MGFMSWLRNAGRSIINTVGNPGRSIMNLGNTIKDDVSTVYKAVTQLPVIGQGIKALAETKLPALGGRSVVDVANVAGSAIDTVNRGVKDLEEGRIPRPIMARAGR
jgi:hypothetical protein